MSQPAFKVKRHDRAEMVRAMRLIRVKAGDVFEVRVLNERGPYYNDRGTFAGFFKDPEQAADAIMARRNDTYVWMSLNPVTEPLYHTIANRLQKVYSNNGSEGLTKDKHILGREWLFIDLDPVRLISGIGSTDEEKAAAYELALKVAAWLAAEYGFPPPVLCDSGNGYHLLYRVALLNDDEATELIKRVLAAIAAHFQTAEVKIDIANSNASRLVKLYGSLSAKGSDTQERPYRVSHFIETPETLAAVTREQLGAVAALFTGPLPEDKPAAKATPPANDGAGAGVAWEGIEIPAWAEPAKEFLIAHNVHLRAKPAPYKAGQKFPIRCVYRGEDHPTGKENAVLFVFPPPKKNALPWFIYVKYDCKRSSCEDNPNKDWSAVFNKLTGQTIEEAAAKADAESDPVKDASDVPQDQPAPPEAPDVEPPEVEEIDGAAVLKQVEQYLKNYVILHDKAYFPLAVWIVLTYCYEEFNCFAYLAILSPERECGKSRLMEVIETLVYKAWYGITPSPAAIYRMLANGRALLFDEVEGFKRNEHRSESMQAILAVLNGGHRKGATVPRVERDKDGNFVVHEFPSYGPKAFGAIGTLPDTLLSRCIDVRMQRRRENQPVQRFLAGRVMKQAAPLRAQILAFVRAYKGVFEQCYEQMPDPHCVKDREADLWMPLIAGEAVFDPDRVAEFKQCALELNGRQKKRVQNQTWGTKLLQHIQEVWPQEKEGEKKGSPQDRCPSATLVTLLKNMDDSPWNGDKPLTQTRLASLLEPFDVEPKLLRYGNDPNEKPARGYEYSPLETAFERYLTCTNAQ